MCKQQYIEQYFQSCSFFVQKNFLLHFTYTKYQSNFKTILIKTNLFYSNNLLIIKITKKKFLPLNILKQSYFQTLNTHFTKLLNTNLTNPVNFFFQHFKPTAIFPFLPYQKISIIQKMNDTINFFGSNKISEIFSKF